MWVGFPSKTENVSQQNENARFVQSTSEIMGRASEKCLGRVFLKEDGPTKDNLVHLGRASGV